MNRPLEVLLQTTIEPTPNDWHIGRFSMLQEYLASLRGPDGEPLFRVTARDRGKVGAPDPVLSQLDDSTYDQLWLFAVDVGDGLHEADLAGITRFQKRGGGLMITRDHMDLGCSICTLQPVGAAHVFHTHNVDATGPAPEPDDRGTPQIQWPNFHSGANGDVQRVQPTLPVHPVMRDVMFLPSHPHEGAVIAPASEPGARVIATGRSLATGRQFNIAVAFEPSATHGPAIAQSTFHHFVDYNWDPTRGCPDFVSEAPVFTLPGASDAMASVHRYVRNVALWLGGRL